jgi:hypothetical protein
LAPILGSSLHRSLKAKCNGTINMGKFMGKLFTIVICIIIFFLSHYFSIYDGSKPGKYKKDNY